MDRARRPPEPAMVVTWPTGCRPRRRVTKRSSVTRSDQSRVAMGHQRHNLFARDQ
jgi:hypothetical protein